MKGRRLLVVDDEPNIRRILQVAFDKVGFQTRVASSGLEALSCLAEQPFDIVLTDVTMPGMTGYDLLREIKNRAPETPVVVMTAFGTIPQAVAAIRDGAYEYVTKPFDLDQLKRTIESACGSSGPSKPARKGKRSGLEVPFLAVSEPMKEVLELVRQVADSKATVMIGGESGVGKEVVARSLHDLSGRATKPFVAVSCAAIPETLIEAELFGFEKGAFTGAQAAKPGRFELADGGTLFLDEIGELPMSTQVKLLRVLQEREVERLGASKPTKIDIRLVTATHRDLLQAVEQGAFRLDLLYRLQVIEMHIPPLRARTEDIVPLAELFLAKYGKENGREPLSVSSKARDAMKDYAWPGNVRELENAMERATVLAPASEKYLEPGLLPSSIRRVT